MTANDVTMPAGALSNTPELSDALLSKSVWNDFDLHAQGIPFVDLPFVSIGGGIGSFCMIDILRIAGVGTQHMAVLSDIGRPTETYEHLASNSQIPRHERLRSDSGSVLDCIWGWPGYALREAWSDRNPGRLWQVMTEPVLAEYFTPRAAQVYESVDRECTRIGWNSMLRPGVVRTIRRREGGDYFVLFTPPAGTAHTKRVAYRCRYVHIAVGYPGVKFLPDLQAYRESHQDFVRVVNAYEPHDHIYEEIRRRPTTILMRGSGIVASRVLQRLIEERDKHGSQTKIVHLFRNYPAHTQNHKRTFRRPVHKGWSYQAFNYPKAAWGGQLRDQLDRLDGPARSAFIDATGGTNTAPRRDWREQLDRGERDGFYTQVQGTVKSVTPSRSGQAVCTTIETPDGHELTLDAEFVVDATGLEASIEEHRVLADLLKHGGAETNPKGRLDVERDFLVRGTDNGEGRIFASGSITLGGYYAGVDSFLGLQYAALQIHDRLASEGFGRKIGATRSARQWAKWARNRVLPS